MAVTGALLVLIAIKLAILPVPAAASPIDGKLLVQLYTIVPPVVGLLKVTAVVGAPLHTTWLATGLTVAKGFTSTVAVVVGPVQVTPPLVYVGVMVNVTVTGPVVVLVKTPLILPVPLAAMPVAVAVLSLTQLNTVPGTVPLNTMVVIAVAEQIV